MCVHVAHLFEFEDIDQAIKRSSNMARCPPRKVPSLAESGEPGRPERLHGLAMKEINVKP